MSNFRVFQLLLVGSLLLTGYTVSNAQSPGTTQFKQPKSSMGLLGTFGYVVESVERGGKADLAGLKTGDVVLRVNDQPFNSVEQLEERLRSQQGKPTELRIGRWNGAEYSSKTFALPASSSLQDLQLNGTLGFVVDEAVPNTPAQQADFQPGDAIIGFEGKSFTSSHELRELAQREPGTRVLLKVQRRENEATHKYDLALVLAPVPATMPVR